MPVAIMTFKNAGVAQLVEYKLPKLGVAGSNPVARSIQQTTESGIQKQPADIMREYKYSVCICASHI